MIEQAELHELEDGTSVLITTAVLFLATKFEAFRDRGKGDFLSSKDIEDIEDIIALVDGREELQSEVLASDAPLRFFVASEFAGFLRCADFEYAVSGYLRGDTSRTALVLERTRAIAGSALK